MQQLTKELRWSGNVSSANIPMLTVPWGTSPFLTHLKLKHPWRIQPWNKTCRHKSLLTPLTTLLRRVPYRGRRSWLQPWGTPKTQERKGPTVPSSGSAPCAKKTMGVKFVIQRDGTFFPGMHDHNHPGEFGVLASTHIQTCVKQVNNHYMF